MSTVGSSVSVEEIPEWKYTIYGTLLGKSDDEKKYLEFMSGKNSFGIHAAIIVVGTIANVMIILEALFGDFSSDLKIYFYQRMIFVALAWLHFYCIVWKKFPNKIPKLPVDMKYCGDGLILSYSICFGAFLYGIATAECEGSDVSPRAMCDHIPIDSALAYVSANLMFAVLIKCRHLISVVLAIGIEGFFMSLIVHIVEPTLPNVMIVFITLSLQCFVVFDSDTYWRQLYLLLIQSQNLMHSKIMTDNENVVMEMQATELRFLIGNVAHDLKTPLQAFSFELEQMKGKSDDADKRNESISLLESICSFMLMTINRSIDYTKVTSGIQLKPSMETVDVSEVFNWVKVCVSHTVNTTKVPIVIDPLPDDMCNFIITDKQWLMENLLCLISNAQKFTNQGNILLRCSFENGNCHVTKERSGKIFELGSHDSDVETACSDDNNAEARVMSAPGMVMVEIIDDGIGISEDMQQTLFKPFKQAMRRAGGTGLGIYSLSKRVESLDGACGVSSRADGKRGARFWFTLPYRPDTSISSNPDSRALVTPRKSSQLFFDNADTLSVNNILVDKNIIEGAVGNEKNVRGRRILLVEDSPLIQKTCARMFLREGITVDIANNGLECLDKVLMTPRPYALILMDINMPVMDGLEAAVRIRDWERNNSLSDLESNDLGFEKFIIIGVSANSDSASKNEALKAGMDRFICKPMKMPELRDCLAGLSIDLSEFKNSSS